MSHTLSPAVQECLVTAAAKALATTGPAGLNVIPVSMINVTETEIWLFDFFMGKTVENIIAEPTTALTAWTDMVGVQIKGSVTYHTRDDRFAEGVAFVQNQNPERVTKGVLILTPAHVYDISPGGHFEESDLF